jgi:hypothetical protein
MSALQRDAESGDGFYHWLAGFIDGEGCFSVMRREKWYTARLIVRLRDDDAPILHVIAERTGIGSLYQCRPQTDTSAAQFMWSVQTKPDALALMGTLDRHPLRAKKRHDYAIWREAVLAWEVRDYERMGACKREIEDGRRYLDLATAGAL